MNLVDNWRNEEHEILTNWLGNRENFSPVKQKDMGRYLKVECPKCGVFEWEKDIQRYLPSYREHQTLLSYWLRNNQKKDEIIHLNDRLVEAIIEKTELPSPTEKAHKLLLLVGSKLKQPAQQIAFTPQKSSSLSQ